MSKRREVLEFAMGGALLAVMLMLLLLAGLTCQEHQARDMQMQRCLEHHPPAECARLCR